MIRKLIGETKILLGFCEYEPISKFESDVWRHIPVQKYTGLIIF
jgi:phage pi2 protein 07